MDIQRLLLFVALAFTMLLIYQRWLEENQPPEPVATGTAGTATPTAPSPPATDTDVPGAPTSAATAAPAPVPGIMDTKATEPASPRVKVQTDLMVAEIELTGGDVRRLSLVEYPTNLYEHDNPFALLKEDGMDIFVTQTGLIGRDRQLPNHKTVFRADQNEYVLKDGQDTLTVPLYWVSPDGVEYTKTYTFERDSYDIRIDFEVDNKSDQPWDGYLYAQFARTQVVPKQSFGFFGVVPSYTGGAIYTREDRFDKIDFSDMADQDLAKNVPWGWVAMLQHYFVGAFFPEGADNYQLYSHVQKGAGGPRYHIGYKTLEPTMVPTGAQGRLTTTLFAGPKEQDRLVKKAEGFDLTVDYGWLTPVSAPLFWVLEQIHRLVGNWGWAIILLTLLIKLAFYPLSAASYKSMAKMKKLQPRLQTLKERYGDDRQKLNQAMMELYKKDKINPLGGCLPILIQIPVFIALYWVLLESVELRQAPFALWLNDLSARDPYFVLPILMGLTMVAQQFLNPAPLDPMQKKIMMALPIVFTVLFLYFPAGLVLYWLVNNVLSIAQQWYINKTLGAPTT
ncbi:MAG: membrane protein insertase YidC [Gammaproteobacteria bacterium]|nr:membrane protein insertase YidC [Gammaproteobacteria bacterium]